MNERQVMNFVLIGPPRCGSSALASSLNALRNTVCHVNLFHDRLDVRRSEHVDYFGADEVRGPDPRVEAPWCVFPGDDSVQPPNNPVYYLDQQIFDHPQRGETCVGARIDYAVAHRWDLQDLLAERWRGGDFCAVHVLRNPVAAYVSREQARVSGCWGRFGDDAAGAKIPLPVWIDPDAFVAAVREWTTEEIRIRDAVRDAIEIHHRDLVTNFGQCVRRIASFLERTIAAVPAPAYRRMRNHPLLRRVLNWNNLHRVVPHDVRKQMDLVGLD